MLKEIIEQPESITNSLRGRLLVDEGTCQARRPRIGEGTSSSRADRIIITACGTSWHAALVGKYMIEQIAGVPVEVEYASEFRYREPILRPTDVVFVISQSGETADTLAALREAKSRGVTALGIVNVVGSTIARETEAGVYIHAGPEIGVASTKAFTSPARRPLAASRSSSARHRGMPPEQGEGPGEGPRGDPRKGQEGLRIDGQDQIHRRGVQERPEFHLPRPRRELPDRPRGGPETEGNFLHPRRGIPGRGDEARADRADRREHAGRVHRAEGQDLRQGAQQHPGGEGARGEDHRHRQRRRRPDRRRSPITSSASRGRSATSVRSSTRSRCSCSPTTWRSRAGCNVDQPRNLAKSVTVE